MSVHDLALCVHVFTYHVVRSIIEADGSRTGEEEALLRAGPEWTVLANAGLIGGDGTPFPALFEVLREAEERLSREIPEAERLSILDRCVEASLVDGDIEYNESAAVVRAARLLGLSTDTWLSRLRAADQLGDLDLPEPEGQEGHLTLPD